MGDQETEELAHKKVDMNVGKLIAKGRQAKEMTQKDLATKICEKPQVVTEYESGKAVPNQAILDKDKGPQKGGQVKPRKRKEQTSCHFDEKGESTEKCQVFQTPL